MATALLIRKGSMDKVWSIHLDHGGSPSEAGRKLLDFYSEPHWAVTLFCLGNLEKLGDSISGFSKRGDESVCVSYHRDKGCPYESNCAKYYSSVEHAVLADFGWGHDYIYYFDGLDWHFAAGDDTGAFKVLS